MCFEVTKHVFYYQACHAIMTGMVTREVEALTWVVVLLSCYFPDISGPCQSCEQVSARFQDLPQNMADFGKAGLKVDICSCLHTNTAGTV